MSRMSGMLCGSKKSVLVLLLLVFSIIFWLKLVNEKDIHQSLKGIPILVSVYYEALCPDSKHFITKQLLPVYRRANSIIDVELVPYGKGRTIINADGSYKFECQHGPVECLANMYHACAIDIIPETKDKIEFIACMINDNVLPEKALYKCASLITSKELDLIIKCYGSLHGQRLLKVHGDATYSIHPPVSFIPTVALDGKQGNQAVLLKNFLSEVCNSLNSDTHVSICGRK